MVHENVNLEKRYSSSTAATISLLDERLVPYELIVRLLERICFEDSAYSSYSSALLIFMPGMGEIRRMHEILMEHPQFASEDHFRIYPLHSTIASDQQAAVFDIPPPDVRKIVIGKERIIVLFRLALTMMYSYQYRRNRYHYTRYNLRHRYGSSAGDAVRVSNIEKFPHGAYANADLTRNDN